MGLSVVTAPTAEPLDLAEVKLHLRVDITDDDTFIAGLISDARDAAESETHNQLVTATWLKTHKQLFRRKVLLPIAPAQSIDFINYIDFSGNLNTTDPSVYQLLSDRFPAQIVLAYLQIWPTTIRNQENDVMIQFKAGWITPFVATSGGGGVLQITESGRQQTNGDVIRVSNSGGTLPGGLAINTDYYVINATGGTVSGTGPTFQLSLSSGGAAIAYSTAGTGSNYVGVLPPSFRRAMLMTISHWYENREAYTAGELKPVGMGVDSALWRNRVVEFE